MSGTVLPGRFVWYDLMASDIASAVDFYARLFGWSTAQWDGEGDPYTMWTNEGVPIGGIMLLPEEASSVNAPPHWIAYISVEDTDEAVKKTEELGGSVIVPAKDIPGEGRFAILQDPLGGAFAPFTPKEMAPGFDDVPVAGRISWNELATTDVEKAFAFYHQVFGWEKADSMDMGDMGVYQMYTAGGPVLGGIFKKPAEVEGPPSWLYYMKVTDADETALTVQMLGGQVMNGPMDVPGGDKVAHCLDPQGGQFAIHQVAEQ